MCDRLNFELGRCIGAASLLRLDFGADLNLVKREVRAFMNPFEIIMNLNHL